MPQDMPPVGGYGDVQYKVRFLGLFLLFFFLCVWEERGQYSIWIGGGNWTTNEGSPSANASGWIGLGWGKRTTWTIRYGIEQGRFGTGTILIRTSWTAERGRERGADCLEASKRVLPSIRCWRAEGCNTKVSKEETESSFIWGGEAPS